MLPSTPFSSTPVSANPTTGLLPSVDNTSFGPDLSQYGQPQDESGAQAPQMQPMHHSGNWFTHLLPTVGGILGGVGGGLLTAGLGGEVAGGAGGAALGRALENALEGKQVVQGNDLTAGLEGGIGQGVGSIAGKVIGGVGGLLATKGAQAAESAAAKNGIDAISQAYGDVPKPLQSLYNASDSLSHIKSLGYNPADANNLVHVGTTSGDILNDTLNGALAKSGPLDLSHYSGLVRQSLAEADPNGGLLGSIDPIRLARGNIGMPNTPAAKIIQQLDSMGAGVTNKATDPNQLRELIDNLSAMTQKLAPRVNSATGALDPQQEAAYNLVNGLRQKLSSALYDRPEINQALTKNVGNLTAEDVGGNQLLADHLNNVLTTAGQNDSTTAAQDLLNEIEHNKNITSLGNEGLKANQIVTSPTARNRMAATAGTTPNATPETSPAQNLFDTAQAGHHLVSGLASHGVIPAVMGVSKAATIAAQNPGVLETLSRVGALASKMAPAAATVVTTAPNLGADPYNVNAATAGGENMNNGSNSQMNGGNGQSLNTFLQTIEQASAIDPNFAASYAPIISALAPIQQRNNVVGSVLSGLEPAYYNAGGPQGSGGILSRISGLIPGTAANTYQRQARGAAEAIAPILGVSPDAAMGILPNLMQNPNSAGINQGILSSLSGQLGY